MKRPHCRSTPALSTAAALLDGWIAPLLDGWTMTGVACPMSLRPPPLSMGSGEALCPARVGTF